MSNKGKLNIPVITVRGSAYEIGVEHGQKAKEAIQHNFQFYLNLWNHFSGVKRNQVLKKAQTFIPYIENLDSELVEELKGVSKGSGMQFEEIVALNSRWELNYAYMMGSSKKVLPEGCTAYALIPEATKNRHVFVGQNWDYKPGVENSCIILRIKQEKKPEILMHTEAGIIGHKGFNSAGIGVCLNLIRCEKDIFQPGLPVWIKVRGILNSKSLPDCLKILTGFEGPNSANMVIAHRDGEAIDVECAPDDTFFLFPSGGVLTHSNHFLFPRFSVKDTAKSLVPDTVIRNHRASRLLQERRGNLDLKTIKNVLKDHFGHPDSICRHRDERLHSNEQWETLTSMIIDLTEGKMLYASGPPCAHPYETIAMGKAY